MTGRTSKDGVREWQIRMREAIVEEGLDLDENSDAVAALAIEKFIQLMHASVGLQKGKCCDNCRCVAFADVLSAITARH